MSAKKSELPKVPQAFFDEFGEGADDRVWDYGRACFEAGRAAPAASGGEVDPYAFSESRREHEAACRDRMNVSGVFKAEPQAAASVSERAPTTVDVIDSLKKLKIMRPGPGDSPEMERMFDVACVMFVLAYADYIEQALTQQRGAEPFKGWYCSHCQRGVDASEVTYHEQHTECGRVITDDEPPATPQPGAEALRELVQRWREAEKRADRDAQANPGDEAQYRYEAGTYKDCADELGSLLARGAK